MQTSPKLSVYYSGYTCLFHLSTPTTFTPNIYVYSTWIIHQSFVHCAFSARAPTSYPQQNLRHLIQIPTFKSKFVRDIHVFSTGLASWKTICFKLFIDIPTRNFMSNFTQVDMFREKLGDRKNWKYS